MQGLSLSNGERPATGAPIAELRSQIVTAFAHRPRPADDRIALADDRYPDYEGNRVAAFFRGQDWHDVSWPALQRYPGDPTASLRFLQDEAFLYYLPAFLRMALEEGEIAEPVSFALADPGPEAPEDSRRFHARMARLSADEKAAVVAVLRHLAHRYERAGEPANPARDALSSYWERLPS